MYPTVKLLNNTIGEVDAAIPQLGAVFGRKMVQRQPAIERRVLAVTAIIPPPSTGVIRWTSERQRRFVRAKMAEHGGPLPRTGAIVDAYGVVVIPSGSGGEVTLNNPHPSAYWVIAEGQQGYLADIGWVNVDDVQPQNEQIVFEEAGFAFNEAIAELL